MKRSSTKTHTIANSKAIHTAVFAIAMISFTLNGWNAQAANMIPTDYRLDTADANFADAWKFMAVFKVRPRRRLLAKRVELAIDTLSTSQENRLIVSLGPMQRPLAVHELNGVAGLANRLLARLARVVLQAFPGSFPANLSTDTLASAAPIQYGHDQPQHRLQLFRSMSASHGRNIMTTHSLNKSPWIVMYPILSIAIVHSFDRSVEVTDIANATATGDDADVFIDTVHFALETHDRRTADPNGGPLNHMVDRTP